TNFTIAVWAGGYEDEDGKRTVMPREGTQVPRALFKHTMEEISKDIETPDFVKPDSVVEVAVEKGTNPPQLPSSYTPDSNIVTELFVKGHEPSQTSEKFDQLDPVNNLKASYDNDENSIHVTWDYDTDDDVSFEISYSIDGGQMQQISSTEDTEMTITEVERGAEYTIQVIAVKDSNKSEPKQTKVLISDEEEEDDDEDIPSVNDLTAAYHENKDVIEVSCKL